jgi:peptidyl-prolyl cis-trans isomerase C
MKYSSALLVAVLATLCACQPKNAAVPGDKSPPVAIVDGTPISRDFYDFYVKGITGGKAPTELNAQQRSAALDNLIRARLVAEQATKDGLDTSGDTAYLLQLSRLNVLEQAEQDRYLKGRKPTDQELRTEYELQIASLPKSEYHARHILLATEPYAEKIVQRLEKGEKFEVLAKEASMDSSKSNGGDLGWFRPDRMVPEFAAAVATLKPGEYTHKPVQTQYGWHVIQLLETRDLTPPTFEQARPRLEQIVEAKKFRLYTDELMHNAKIENFLDQPPKAGTAPGGAGQAPAPRATAPAQAPTGAAPTGAAPARSAPAAAPASTAPAAPPKPGKN